MSQSHNNVIASAASVILKGSTIVGGEILENVDINDVPTGTILQFENSAGEVIDASTAQYVNVRELFDTNAHLQVDDSALGASGNTYIYNEETGDLQLIDLNNVTTIEGEDVEIVSVDSRDIFTEFQSLTSGSLQLIDGSFNSVEVPSYSPSAGSASQIVSKLEGSSNISVSRYKNAPALLRNSRKAAVVDESPSGNRVSSSTNKDSSSSGVIIKPVGGKPPTATSSTSSNSRKKSVQSVSRLIGAGGQLFLLNDDRLNTETVAPPLVEPFSPKVALKNSCGQLPASFYTYHQVDEDQKIELTQNTFVNQFDTNHVYQLDDGSSVIFFTDGNAHDVQNLTTSKTVKPKKCPKRTKKAVVTSGESPKKASNNRGGGTLEARCLEKGCDVVAHNVNELRKHLTDVHELTFDLERKEFSSDAAFKEWRHQYEKDRMVSFIYRGGTKKISEVQSVTYMICHRSGHYKPTMADTATRKRKMKPQGSCKIGGYCTAGMKLIRNLETREMLVEICHTHYGHPLDSEALPHLRVNPILKKIIIKKFEEGMSFANMLAYIHHNPDRLEGLRVVDRRAVRNIYDTWNKPRKANLKQSSPENNHVQVKNLNELELTKEITDLNSKEVRTSTNESINEQTSPNVNFIAEDSQNVPVLYPTTQGADDDYTNNEANELEEEPPLLISIDSVKSLNPAEFQANSTPGAAIQSSKKIVMKTAETESKSLGEKSCTTKIKFGTIKLRAQKGKKKLVKKPRVKSVNMALSTVKETYSKSRVENPANQASQTRISASSSSQVVDQVIEENSDSFEFQQIKISPELDTAIDKLNNHGEAGPTILLYKKVGTINVKYGGFCRALREDDFCLIVQTPVQRQIFQLFPKVVSIEILDSPTPNEHDLKLAFISVLDDFREAIPVAWMIVDSVGPRYLNQFFRMLRYHCGELSVQYIMAPRNVDVFKSWTAHFSHKPKILQSEHYAKRDLRTLLCRHFPNGAQRNSAWTVIENLLYEKSLKKIKTHKGNLEKVSQAIGDSGKAYWRKMEKDWLSRIEEWSFAYRLGTQTNLLFAADSFSKLRRFISFKGTSQLNRCIDHILKIGYDKCFLRTKRMFKGDQKLSNLVKNVEECHHKAVTSLDEAIVTELDDKNVWELEIEVGVSVSVIYLQSPCDCKIKCKTCNICMHEYMCTCDEFVKLQNMCAHIHKVHCIRHGISLQLEEKSKNTPGEGVKKCTPINGKRKEPSDADDDVCDDGGVIASEITIINESEMEHLNITEVLGLLGQQEGQEMPKIVSITDIETQQVIYNGSSSSPLTIFQLDPD